MFVMRVSFTISNACSELNNLEKIIDQENKITRARIKETNDNLKRVIFHTPESVFTSPRLGRRHL